jgi:hypothetical protein
MQPIGDVAPSKTFPDKRIDLLESDLGINNCSPGQSLLRFDSKKSLLGGTKNSLRFARSNVPDEPISYAGSFVNRIPSNTMF